MKTCFKMSRRQPGKKCFLEVPVRFETTLFAPILKAKILTVGVHGGAFRLSATVQQESQVVQTSWITYNLYVTLVVSKKDGSAHNSCAI